MAAKRYVFKHADAPKYIKELKEFKGFNLFAKRKVYYSATGKPAYYYIVYSYHERLPILVYSSANGTWYENSDKLSAFPAKHLNLCRPDVDNIVPCSREELLEMIRG